MAITAPSTSHSSSKPSDIQFLPCAKSDLYHVAYLEYLAFEHDEFSDLAFGRERGGGEALEMRVRQLEKFLDGGKGWYVKAVLREGKEGDEGEEKVVGIAGWCLGGGKEEKENEGEGSQKGTKEESNDNEGNEKGEEASEPKNVRTRTREELDEIWGKGSNVKLCEDVFVKGDEYMFGACGDREWLKLNILVIHPSYQRLGIGTQLLTQGLALADEKGIQMVLGASPWGIGLYRRYGFVDVHVMDIRLEEYEGGEGMGETKHVIMWRPGKGKEEGV